MASRLPPYLQRKAGKAGFYFMRRVPKDVLEVVGMTYWRKLLAPDLATARLLLPAEIARTDLIIQGIRATGQAPEEPQRRPVISREMQRLAWQGMPAQEIWNDPSCNLDDDQITELSELPPVQFTAKTVVTTDDILQKSILVKNPAAQTINSYNQALGLLTKDLGTDQIHLLTPDKCRELRDKWLGQFKTSTVKTRLNFLQGLFNLAKEEGLIDMNPWLGVGKRLTPEKKKHKEIKPEKIAAIDQLIATKLNAQQQDLYCILRWSGMRVAEAAGLRTSDIHLDVDVPYVELEEIGGELPRPLKNSWSERKWPIHKNAMEVMKRLKNGPERPFGNLYNKTYKRWANQMKWRSKIDLSPHELRHFVPSQLRDAGVDEYLISRLLGHEPGNLTGRTYGTVSLKRLQEAMNKLK